MEITTVRSQGGVAEVRVKGRLDAYWSEHFAKDLQELVRSGVSRILVDLSQVSYMSSMGIGVLVEKYKALAAIRGSFGIVNPSPQVQKVLSLTGLLDQLTSRSMAAEAPVEENLTTVERPFATYEVSASGDVAGLRCRAIGQPETLSAASLEDETCRTIAFPDSAVAVGLGAFGNSLEDSRHRFGEFLAAGGAAVYQPSDGSDVADYNVASEALVPEVQVLYALAAEGEFSHTARFHARETGVVSLSELVADCLSIAGADRAAIVIVAESTGLLGAALRKSPFAGARTGDLFAHPEVRQWISYSPDRVHARATTLVAGFASASTPEPMDKFLRPMGNLQGHFHAAAFSYQPLRRGKLNLNETVRSLFAGGVLHNVLHLISDDRGTSGAGETEFVRGACWIGKISEAVSEDAA
jgi:anti-anti-sigma factor